MLACFEEQTGFTEERPSIPGAGKSKNRCKIEQLALPNIKRSGFVLF
jgi:hypothetical protein